MEDIFNSKIPVKKKLQKHDNFGHRSRLRQKIIRSPEGILPDSDILEVLLFAANPMGDTKPLAKTLLKEFGSIESLIYTDFADLSKIDGVGETTLALIKSIREILVRVLKHRIDKKPILQNWTSLLDYCKLTMGGMKKEQFRILFLDNKNRLIDDKIQSEGTIDQTSLYVREVVEQVISVKASSIILVHNHPSGDCTPSKNDVILTKQVIASLSSISASVHDHIIISLEEHFSFKNSGLI